VQFIGYLLLLVLVAVQRTYRIDLRLCALSWRQRQAAFLNRCHRPLLSRQTAGTWFRSGIICAAILWQQGLRRLQGQNDWPLPKGPVL